MMTQVLIDSSYLVALGARSDKHHARALRFAREKDYSLLLPTIVLPEAVYLLRQLGGARGALRFLERLSTQNVPFVDLLPADFARAIQIMQRYADTELDLVDACITAIGERLNITHVCTFDRRDFSIIRPKHTAYFTLLP